MPEPRSAASARDAVLYVVATPIGNLGDITARALDVLRKVDLVAAEDTRHSRKLLNHFSIETPLVACHEFSSGAELQKLLQKLEQGRQVALISDAGTPLISDPGFALVRLAHERGYRVEPIPGACAAIAALSVGGLPCDAFLFAGFLPPKSRAREQALERLSLEQATLVFYEAPHRLLDTLEAMSRIFGEDRPAVLARELTKTFETVVRASLASLSDLVRSDANQSKGECVLLVQGCVAEAKDAVDPEALRILDILLQDLPVAQAAALASKITGFRKRELYQLALERKA